VLPDAPHLDVWSAVAGWLLRQAFAAGASVALAHPDDAAEARCLDALGFTPAGDLDVYVDLV
jgi:hypothetical protein